MSHEARDYEPFVSVAMAVYNGEKFIGEMLDSLLAQTYQNFEVVISDDKSTDRTQEILDEYAKKDKRIRWSINPAPAGLSKNFERAFLQCTGEIIFVCDADDVWYPEKLAKHVEAYRDPSVMWVYNRSVLTDEHGKEIGYVEDRDPEYFTRKRSMLMNTWGSCIGGAHASYRASKLKAVMPVDPNAGAFDSWIQLAIWPGKSAFVNEILQTYRQHGRNAAGWSAATEKVDPETEKRTETLAIINNLRLVASVPFNQTLPKWKRFYFAAIYLGKFLRSVVRG